MVTNNVACCCGQCVLKSASNTDSIFFFFRSLNAKKVRISQVAIYKLAMEELFLRFPHLSENIFEALDNKSFADSKEVSKVWYNYLDDQKFVQERQVRMIKKMIKKFRPDFQQNLGVEFKRVYCSWSKSFLIIYRLATRSKHEEVMNYLRLKYRFVNIKEYEKSLMIQ